MQNGLKSFTDQQLLAELIRRNPPADAPTTIMLRGAKESLVAVGNDETARIIVYPDAMDTMFPVPEEQAPREAA